MKHALVFIPLAVMTTGCSPLLYSGDYGYRRPLPSPYAMRTMAPAPLPVGRWDNVMRLPPQSTIDVLTLDGVPKIGPIVGADGQSVVVQVNGIDVRVARAEIVRVDLVDPAGSEAAAVARSTARGALLGVGAAAVIGAVIGGPAWPPPGVLLRAGVAGGAATGAQAALLNRQPRMIYLAPGQAPVRYPYSQVPYPERPGDPIEGAFDLPACAQERGVAGVRQAGPPNGVQSPVVRRVGVTNSVRGAVGSSRR